MSGLTPAPQKTELVDKFARMAPIRPRRRSAFEVLRLTDICTHVLAADPKLLDANMHVSSTMLLPVFNLISSRHLARIVKLSPGNNSQDGRRKWGAEEENILPDERQQWGKNKGVLWEGM